ncbi:MerR family transcriptional regulator [Micromonospora sp. NPDC005257]|uniref:MerR family transcriptional regulator n=1 Tax=Micromonospora sp. NPDC005257 TaxID=3364230 RepID=UPI00368C7E1F
MTIVADSRQGHSAMGVGLRISELARRAGMPIPTVKFYLREGLLPPGTPTARNQARYEECHLERLRLIRALTTVGGLEIGAVRGLLTVLEDPSMTLAGVYAGLDRVGVTAPPYPADFDGMEAARSDIDALADRLGWDEEATRSGRESLVQVLTTLRALGCDAHGRYFLTFAEAAGSVVEAEMDLIRGSGRDAKAEAMVRSVLFDVLMSVMMRTVRRNQVAARFGD